MERLDALLDNSKQERRTSLAPCKVSLIGATLPTTYQEAFYRITDVSWEAGGLSADAAMVKLDSAGISISATTIRRHRMGYCGCPEKG